MQQRSYQSSSMHKQKIQSQSSFHQQHKHQQQKPSQSLSSSLKLHQARDIMRQFVSQRQWHTFHTPRNLLLALVGQVGQISEIFQWKGQVSVNLPQFSQKQKQHLGQQIADVFSYLIRLADVSGIDISTAFKDKVQKNKKKYPKQIVKGSSKKYNQYKQNGKLNKQQQQQQ